MFTVNNLKQIAKDYIDFVVSLPILNTTVKILIIGIYPSPLLDSNVGASLKAYGIRNTTASRCCESVN